ncbi:hypothetical protein [Mongoliimonas terrestris]|uniref:hypothetical protein n=1 Tax=Mongoliimonas terrestris TaxID=1709001 RepID=UPI0009496EB7|nr:hypothetical protein [Mongoliimonas terrestris]
MKNALFGAAALTLAVAIAPSSAAACNDPDFNYFTGCTLQQFADIWVPANLAWIPPGAYPFEGDFSVDDGFPSDGY